MIAHTSVVRPAMERLKPGMSSRGADGSLDSGTSQRPASSAAATNGRLTRKMACQLACSIASRRRRGRSRCRGPRPPPTSPIAFGRSSGGKTAVMIDSVDGMMNAPPTPIRARVAISASGEAATAERPEPRPKIASPNASARLRPKRSPSAPAVRRTGEDEHVGVHDRLELGAGRAEVALERGERDVEDGVVEPDHEERGRRGRRGSTSAGGRAGSGKTRRYRFGS